MAGPIITLTTDFGLIDEYVGVLKGVILSYLYDARIIDITHAIAPQDISGASIDPHPCRGIFPGFHSPPCGGRSGRWLRPADSGS